MRALVVVVVVGFSVLAGLAIAVGAGPLVVVLGAGTLLATLLVLLKAGGRLDEGGAMLFLLVMALLPASLLRTFLSPAFSAAADLWLLLVLPLALLLLPPVMQRVSVLWWAVGAYVLYLMLAVLSTAASRSGTWQAALFQAAFNLRLPAMFIVGLAFPWSPQRTQRLRRLLWVGLVLVMAFILVEVAAPGLHKALAVGRTESETQLNYLLRGALNRLCGFYAHPSLLGISAAFTGVLFFVSALVQGRWRLGDVVGLGLSSLLLLLSGQRQESFAFVVTLLLLWALARSRPSAGVVAGLVIGVTVVFTAVSAAGGLQVLDRLSRHNAATAHIVDARAVLTRDGFALAARTFPLGTGLGTFGSVGARDMNRSLYDELGYWRYWWYQQDLYLIDTYWPSIVAESGWIGGAALLTALLLLLGYCLAMFWTERSSTQTRWLFGVAAGGQLLVMLTSPTSALYADPTHSLWLLMWTGIALRQRARLATGDTAAAPQLHPAWSRWDKRALS